MGVPLLFSRWIQKNYSKDIKLVKCNFSESNFFMKNKLINKEHELTKNILLLDLNGIIHRQCQKVFKYNNKEKSVKPIYFNKDTQLQVFNGIIDQISKLIIVSQCDKLFISVDGVTPRAKANQQRTRRFKKVKEQDNKVKFDSNSISPGTKFMEYLHRFILFNIYDKLNKKIWNCEILYSSHRVPGEGEHKIFNYINNYLKNLLDLNLQSPINYIVYGLDADLIMLSLSVHIDNLEKTKLFILREDLFCDENDYFLIDINSIKYKLLKKLIVSTEKTQSNGNIILSKFYQENLTNKVSLDDQLHIYNFIFLSFLLGNDFLPNIPGLEIAHMGIDNLINIYRGFITKHNNLSTYINSKIAIDTKQLKYLFKYLSQYETQLLNGKVNSNNFYFEDKLLNIFKKPFINKYKLQYYKTNFNISVKKTRQVEIINNYIETLLWTFEYYIFNIANWDNYYKFHYAPFLTDIAKHMDIQSISYDNIYINNTKPCDPFLLLLTILPKKSSNLIDKEYRTILSDNNLATYFPDKFKIDIQGKRKLYEGIALIPHLDFEYIKDKYMDIKQQLMLNLEDISTKSDIRNKCDMTKLFKTTNNFTFNYKSIYGTINNCKVRYCYGKKIIFGK